MGFKVTIANEGETLDIAQPDTLLNICDAQPCAILFGCRDGLCGTCLIEVNEGMENLSKVDDEEKEMLEAMADGNDKARLACQCKVSGDINVEYIG